MSALLGRAAAFGFDAGQLTFFLRTAAAACLALVFAWLVGLEHPQWAAMTVWAASQPTRGQLLEKGFFRLMGTIVGVIVGVALVITAAGDNLRLVIGLSLWIGLCAAAGNLLRGYVTYGAVLSGYSASMVALLDTAEPDQVFAVGFDRLLTILTGVVIAVAVGWIFSAMISGGALSDRLRALTVRLLRDMAGGVRDGAVKGPEELTHLLSDMASLEEALEPHGAGSLRSRRFVRTARSLLIAQVACLLWLRNGRSHPWPEQLARELDLAAAGLEGMKDAEAIDAALQRAIAICGLATPLGQVLVPLAGAIHDHKTLDADDRERVRRAYPLMLHKDWVGARQSFLRAVLAMMTVGLFWLATGWESGPYMLLGLSVFVSLFSTFENPAHILRFVILGQIVGVGGALACRWLVWPFATSEWQLVALMMPFMIFGAFFAAHRRTAPLGFDYNMVTLILLKPAMPLTGSFVTWLGAGAAMVAGPLAALVTFRLVYPVDAKRRMQSLMETMVGELKQIAGRPQAPARRTTWRGRFYYRLLRLIRLQEKTGGDARAIVGRGLAVLNIGNALFELHRRNVDPATPVSVRRAVGVALRRLEEIETDPDAAFAAVARAAARVGAVDPLHAHTLQRAAEDIRLNRDLLSGK